METKKYIYGIKRLVGNPRHTIISIFTALLLIVFTAGCGAEVQNTDYGVFLSVTEDIDSLSGYNTVVIDAQYFSKAEIDAFRAAGHKVCTPPQRSFAETSLSGRRILPK